MMNLLLLQYFQEWEKEWMIPLLLLRSQGDVDAGVIISWHGSIVKSSPKRVEVIAQAVGFVQRIVYTSKHFEAMRSVKRGIPTRAQTQQYIRFSESIVGIVQRNMVNVINRDICCKSSDH